jgi:hypothetical protein
MEGAMKIKWEDVHHVHNAQLAYWKTQAQPWPRLNIPISNMGDRFHFPDEKFETTTYGQASVFLLQP